MQVVIIGIVGIVLLIAGIAVATIRGTGLRGSGLGTVLIVLGVLVLVFAAYRLRSTGSGTVSTTTKPASGSQMSGESKFCKKCGTKMSAAAEFCPSCGAKQV